ncbi:MAG: ABC transporter permease [Terracidiphilus sp.]
MSSTLYDLRFALRQLRKSPGFTLTAVLTLAFGIGATTAIFSIVEGVLLRPLPFPQPERLVSLGDIVEGTGSDNGAISGVTAPEIRSYMQNTRGFASLGAYQQDNYELSGVGDPLQINAARLTASVFPVLGVSPLMGRPFTQKEDESNQQVTVISYQMWHSRFHGDPTILRRKILLDRKPYEIIGVMPRDFEFPLVPGQLNRSELWVPMSLTAQEGAGSWNFNMVGRLKPGVTAMQAQQDAVPVAQEIMRAFPPFMASLRIHPVVKSLQEYTVEEARPMVRTLFLAVAVVLFIACANLASLLLVRVIRRRREIAVRLALGANAGVVIRQNLIEALVLSVAGGLLGLGLAAVALRVGLSFLPETLPRISSITLDWQVMFFALLLAVFTGFLCGLLPAWSASRTNLNDAIKEGGRTGTSGGGHVRLRSMLVIAEVAVALVLLTAAGLLLRSFDKLRAVNLGFQTDHTLTALYSLPQRQYSTQASVDAFNNALMEKLRQAPGVKTAGVTTQLPSGGSSSTTVFVVEGYVPPKGADLSLAWQSQIIGDYFRAAGIPLLRGREFTDADNAKSPLVVVVNHSMAQHYWPGQDPIGKRVRWGLPESPTPWLTVVGEIGDIKQNGADLPTKEQIYQPSSQGVASFGSLVPAGILNGNGGSIVMRTMLPPEEMANALRSAVHSIDPQLALTQVESMDQVVAEGEASRRFNTMLISSFAAAAVLLALLGIYSVIAFSAAMRTQEMAIRLALGSQRSAVMRLVLTSGAKLGLAGCGIGALAAVFATRLLRSLLFEVNPLDPLVLAVAALSIFLLALAASAVPARRAASIEPMQALRNE